MLTGTDISAHQASTVPPGDFVIIKATQGISYTSSKLAAQLTDARRKRMLVGFYHFPEYGNPPASDALHFCDIVAPLLAPGDIVVLDHEAEHPPSASRAAAWGRAWLARVEARLGRRPWVYANVSWAAGGYCEGMGAYPYWCADPSSPPGRPRVRGPWRSWVAHQYSWAGGLDKDVFNGSAADWRALGQPNQQEDDMAQVVSAGVDGAGQEIPAGGEASVRWTRQFSDRHGLFKEDKDGGAYSLVILDKDAGELWAQAAALFKLTGLQPGDRVRVSWDRMAPPAKDGEPWQVSDHAWSRPYIADARGEIEDEIGGSFGLDSSVRLRLRVYNESPRPATLTGGMAKVLLYKY